MSIEEESSPDVIGVGQTSPLKSTNNAIAFEKLSTEHPYVVPLNSSHSSEVEVAEASTISPLKIPPRLLEHKDDSATGCGFNFFTACKLKPDTDMTPDDMARYIAVMGGDNAGIPITPKDMEDPDVQDAAMVALAVPIIGFEGLAVGALAGDIVEGYRIYRALRVLNKYTGADFYTGEGQPFPLNSFRAFMRQARHRVWPPELQ